MILNRQVTILLLLITVNITAAVEIGYALLNFKDDSVRGIYRYGTNFLGVALNREVYVGQLQDEMLIEFARIPLNKFVHANSSGESLLLEFNLINELTVLTCTSNGCSVCSQSATSSPNCYGIPLPSNHGILSSVSASFVNNDIVLRTVHNKGDASIHYFTPNHKLKIYESSGRRSDDASSLSEFETVAGFSTRTHSYFIGSAKRLDLPLFSFNYKYKRNNTDIRITRICNNDETANLSSRIDLVLSCQGINYKQPRKTVSNRATAALYLPDASKLLVAFQHGESHDLNYICSYDFMELQKRFTKTWNKCQSMPKPQLTKNYCIEQFDSYDELTDECFLFSWENQMSKPYCAAYNGAMGDDKFDNCELHASKSTYRAYGSIENFKPYDGKLLFTEKHAQPIVAIREIQNEGALYAIRKDNQFLRLLIGDEKTSAVLISSPGKSGKHLLEVLPNSNRVLYVPSSSSTTINSFTSSCGEIYGTCYRIAWNDPLRCIFCVNEDGTGSVVPDKTCPSNNIHKHVCPPYIIYAQVRIPTTTTTMPTTTTTTTSTTTVPSTTTMATTTTATTTVPTTTTTMPTTTTTVPTTITPMPNTTTAATTTPTTAATVSTALTAPLTTTTMATTTIFTITIPNSTTMSTTAIPIENDPMNSLFVWKVVIFVSTFAVLLVFSCFIYICVFRRCAKKRNQNYGRVHDEVPLHEQHNPIGEQLNPSDLVVLNMQLLGEGSTANVYKGFFKTTPRDYEPVAIKILKDNYTPLINTIINELKTLRRVQHGNIVVFIGHTYIARTLHIVTEYMAGGSLLDYISNPSILLKYQQTFDYMDQILSAMVYLTGRNIVHRDLAARNCLLNADYTVLKVSDFGLARSVDFNGEYQILTTNTDLPVRWIAVEAFSHHRFSEKTDIWSFGVLVWELFSRGHTPYNQLDMSQIREFLNSGRRLQRPVSCPCEIYDLMKKCWDAEPLTRPTFEQLQHYMKQVVRYITNANRQLSETEYERPNNQPLTYVRNDTVAEVSI